MKNRLLLAFTVALVVGCDKMPKPDEGPNKGPEGGKMSQAGAPPGGNATAPATGAPAGGGGVAPIGSGMAGGLTPMSGTENLGNGSGGGVGNAAKNMARSAAEKSQGAGAPAASDD